MCGIFFFFSSRRRHTRWTGDWSSDVCSSDLVLRAATEVVLPVALTYLALDGCAELMDSLERLREERGEAPAVTLIVPALYRKTQRADEILGKLRDRFPAAVSGTIFGWSVKVDEAQSLGLTVFEYAPASSGAHALAALADELLERAPAAVRTV